MQRFKALQNVPFGSVLKVWVELESGHVQIDGLVVSSEGAHDDREWKTGQLLRTPQHPDRAGCKKLSAPDGYYVRVSTFCEDPVEGRLTIQAVTLEGEIHEMPLTWDISGDQGDNHLNGAFVQMGDS